MGKISRTVLIVGKREQDRELYRQYLSADPTYDYRVVEAGQLLDAQALCREVASASLEESKGSKALLVEEHLPDGSGLSFVINLRASGFVDWVPLLLLAPETAEQSASEALAAGISEYLIQGEVTPVGLRIALNRAICRAEAAQSHLHNRQLGDADDFGRTLRDYHQMQRQLQESESLKDLLLEHSPDCIKVLDLGGRLLYINPSGKAALGIRSFEDYQCANWLDFWKGESRLAAKQALENARRGQSSEFYGRCLPQESLSAEASPEETSPKKTPLWWNVTVQPVINPGEKLSKLLVISRDVSDRIRSEEQLKRANILLESALSAGDVCPWRFDVVNNTVAADAKLAQLFGIEPQIAAQGLPLENYIAAIHPADRDRVAAAIEEAIATGDPFQCEYRVLNAKGNEHTVSARGRVEYNLHGAAVAFPGILFDITERRRMEAAIERSEQRSRIILDSLLSFVGVVTLEGILVEANRPALEAAGLTPEDVLGKPFAETYWWSYSPEIQAQLQAAIKRAAAGELIRYDVEVRVRDNQLITIDFTLVPVLNAAGQVDYLIPSGIDITERKQAEKALRESEQLLRLALASAQAGSWQWTLATNKVVWSTENYDLYGIDPTEEVITYDHWYHCVHPEDRAWVSAELNRVIDQQLPEFRAEFRIRHPQAGIRWLLALGKLVLNEAGNPVQLNGINLDVTARKQIDLQVIAQKNIIAQQLAEIEAIYRNAPIGLTILDRQLRFTRINQQLADINGFSIEDHLGRTVRELLPDLADTAEPLLQEVLDTGEPKLNVELTGETPAQPGIRRVWSENFYPIKDLTGRTVGINIAAQEITDRKQAEQEREQLLAREQAARKEAETASRIKDEFLAIVSHELRTPLSPILGWSQLLSRGKLQGDKAKEALETIARNAKMQAQLVDDLLDVSRILRGKLSLEAKPVDLVTVTRMALETVRLSAEAKHISVHTAFDPTASPVLGDIGRLQQVVWNLLSNAVKFTPAGGRVDIDLSRRGNQAYLTVCDTGKGIPASFLPHVFDRFSQEDGATTRQFSGLGLGLSIARYLVELHGGTITAESPGEGQGATFIVSLPIIELPVGDSQEAAADSVSTLEGARILVVDDDADAREITAFVLENAGAEVTALASAEEVFTALAQAPFDLLVSDIGMPEVDGYELMRRIRVLPPEQGGTIGAIALTAYAGEIDYQQAKQAGFQKHLAKPVEPHHLVKIAATMFQHRRSS